MPSNFTSGCALAGNCGGLSPPGHPPYGRPPAEWCARGLGLTVEAMLQKCCAVDSEPCFDNIADILGDKCCRTTAFGGFFGFLSTARPFEFSNMSGRPRDKSLWSMSNFVVLKSKAETKLQELESLGLVDSAQLDLEPTWRISLPAGRPVADRVRVPWRAAYVYRFYHPYAELVRQTIWEHQHYQERQPEFDNNLEQRTKLRYGSCPCGQYEASADHIMSDRVAMTWIAQRWERLGNPALSTFVNLGARDGIGDDPLQQLIANPAAVEFALAVEMDERFCASHAQNFPHVRVLCTHVTSATIDGVVAHLPTTFRQGPVLATASTGAAWPQLDVLKVDLDAADCDVVGAFLASAPSKFVVTEVYDGFPPPVQFALHESDGLHREKSAQRQPTPWGCSLSYQARLLGTFSFGLVWYGAGNAVFAHETVIPYVGLPGPLDEVDCAVKSLLMSMWPDGRTMRRWFYEEPLGDALEEMRRALHTVLPDQEFTLKV